MRNIAADLGLGIDMLQPFRDFEGVSAAQLARNLDRAERKFDLMQELGAPLILVCSNVQPTRQARLSSSPHSSTTRLLMTASSSR